MNFTQNNEMLSCTFSQSRKEVLPHTCTIRVFYLQKQNIMYVRSNFVSKAQGMLSNLPKCTYFSAVHDDAQVCSIYARADFNYVF